jgi:hypothetical protein
LAGCPFTALNLPEADLYTLAMSLSLYKLAQKASVGTKVWHAVTVNAARRCELVYEGGEHGGQL